MLLSLYLVGFITVYLWYWYINPSVTGRQLLGISLAWFILVAFQIWYSILCPVLFQITGAPVLYSNTENDDTKGKSSEQ